MFELSESAAPDYLRRSGRASGAELLIQSLSGGVANVVLKVFDTGAGPKVGSDLRSPAQIKNNKPDARPHQGHCFVLKQPLGKFKTQAEWLVDIDRGKVERDSMILLASLLPQGSIPEVLWYDDDNYILAIECAPVGSVIWKKALMDGHVSMDAAVQAGMLLAMMHSSTHNDPAVKKRYGDPKFFIQQRVDPYLHHTAGKHPEVAPLLNGLGEKLLGVQHCLIHGDYSPKNIFLVPDDGQDPSENAKRETRNAKLHLMILDFEVAFFGHAAFDVATLINHFLLKGFMHHRKWRPFMMMADDFWQTYRNTAAPELVRATDDIGGHLLGALMLARVDGKSPAEYLLPHPEICNQVRKAAIDILSQKDATLDHAMDTASVHFDEPE
ncbi:MAG: phosphotransferase [Phycisphaerales bacterium]|nr:phosphotransferase [Phycisphaerales bacterium]